MGKNNPSTRGRRICMRQSDKDALRRNLVFSLESCGVSRELAEKAITARNPSMEGWIQRWICHHTDYENEGLTEDSFRKGCGAWIVYKACVETPDKLEILPETRERWKTLVKKLVEDESGREDQDAD